MSRLILGVLFVAGAVAAPSGVDGQSFDALSVGAFAAMEKPHQHAIAGAFLGALSAGRNELPGALAICIHEWEANHPDSYITTLTDSWVDLVQIGVLGAPLDTSVDVATFSAQPLAPVLLGFLSMGCEETR
ncbi:MAG: hypothetical protein AB7T31_15315 [Gemmatimonadales bacterium]